MYFSDNLNGVVSRSSADTSIRISCITTALIAIRQQSDYIKNKQAVWPPGLADTVCPRPPQTLTFDRMTLKMVCKSHLRWGTFLPNFGMLRLLVCGLFAMYATDGQIDGQTDKTNAYCPLPYSRGIIRQTVTYQNWGIFSDNHTWSKSKHIGRTLVRYSSSTTLLRRQNHWQSPHHMAPDG